MWNLFETYFNGIVVIKKIAKRMCVTDLLYTVLSVEYDVYIIYVSSKTLTKEFMYKCFLLLFKVFKVIDDVVSFFKLM